MKINSSIAIIAIILLLSGFGIGANIFLALLATGVLLVGYLLLWRPGEPPVLMYVFAFQWLQVCLPIYHANLLGLTISESSILGGNVERATLLALVGLVALALGIRFGIGRFGSRSSMDPGVMVQAPQSKWIKLYVAAFLVAMLAEWGAQQTAGLAQPLLALANLKWAFYLGLTIVTFSRRDSNKLIWLAIALLEFALSLGGYFSSFQAVLVFTLLGLIAANVRFTPMRLLGLAAIAVFSVTLLVYWTAVKGEYRNYLNGGENSQIITADYPERIAKLFELLQGVDDVALQRSAEELARRIAYTDLFGVVVEHVPQAVPHEGGNLTLEAITRPLQPRLLFPDKTALDDSSITNKYTGLSVAGADTGTSISIGYMAESYVDFGSMGMMGLVFLIGLSIGLIYRWLALNKSLMALLGLALACAIVFQVRGFETSMAKTVGTLAISALTVWILIKLVQLGRIPWIARKKTNTRLLSSR